MSECVTVSVPPLFETPPPEPLGAAVRCRPRSASACPRCGCSRRSSRSIQSALPKKMLSPEIVTVGRKLFALGWISNTREVADVVSWKISVVWAPEPDDDDVLLDLQRAAAEVVGSSDPRGRRRSCPPGVVGREVVLVVMSWRSEHVPLGRVRACRADAGVAGRPDRVRRRLRLRRESRAGEQGDDDRHHRASSAVPSARPRRPHPAVLESPHLRHLPILLAYGCRLVPYLRLSPMNGRRPLVLLPARRLGEVLVTRPDQERSCA